MRVSVFLLIAAVALGCALALSVRHGGRLRRECRRLEQNERVLLGEVREYRVRDSLNAATVGVLTLRAAEMDAHCASLAAMVRDLGIKLRRVEAASEHALSSRYEITAPVRDTVFLTAGLPDDPVAGQAVRFRDPHLDFEGVIRGGEFTGTIACYDTLTQVVHRIPRRFLFIRWGAKALQQEIVSSNPHTRIVYSRYIRVVK